VKLRGEEGDREVEKVKKVIPPAEEEEGEEEEPNELSSLIHDTLPSEYVGFLWREEEGKEEEGGGVRRRWRKRRRRRRYILRLIASGGRRRAPTFSQAEGGRVRTISNFWRRYRRAA